MSVPLERLLQENYHFLKSRECERRVLDFLSKRGSVRDMPILFVKKLTKVANHILAADPDVLSGLVERLYNFNLEGVASVQSGGLEDYIEENLASLRLHFYRHAGRAAKACFKKTNDLTWAERWYEAAKAGAELSLDTDPKHAAYAFGFVAEAAKIIFERTGVLSFAEEWYNYDLLAAEMNSDSDLKHAVLCFNFASNAADALFKKEMGINPLRAKEWAENDAEVNYLATKLLIGTNPQTATKNYSRVVNALQKRFNLLKQEGSPNLREEAERVYHSAVYCLKLSQEANFQRDDPRFIGHRYLDLASVSRQLFELTQDCYWGEERYYALRQAVDCFERANIPKLVADYQNQQGHSARLLAERCKQQNLDELASYWRKVAYHDFKCSALQSSEPRQRAHRFRRAGEAAFEEFKSVHPSELPAFFRRILGFWHQLPKKENAVYIALEALDCFYRYVNFSAQNVPPPEFEEKAAELAENTKQRIISLENDRIVLGSKQFQQRRIYFMHKV